MGYDKAWEIAYHRDRAAGRRRYVPAHDTRARLQDLVHAHVPLRTIARAAGLSDTAVNHIVSGQHKRVRRNTAERVAALNLADVYDQASGLVPSVGAVRRVQALMALGWRKADLADQGVPAGQLVARSRDLIGVTRWRQVREVYDRLSMTPGPSQAARDRAAARGYLPPLAWDEETIDDPRATTQDGEEGEAALDCVAVDRAVDMAAADASCGTDLPLTQDERIAVVRRLTARGSSDTEVAGVLGVSDRTVLRLRQRHAIPPGRPPTRSTPGDQAASSPQHDPTGAERLRRSTRAAELSTAPGASSIGASRPAVGA
jgi:hypothetical protein